VPWELQSVIFHFFDDLIDVGILLILLPKLKNPVVPFSFGFLTYLRGDLSWITQVKIIPDEIHSFHHHDLHAGVVGVSLFATLTRLD